MLHLVLKDLRVQKRQFTLLIVLFLSVTMSVILPYNPGLAAAQLLIGVYIMVVYANAFDFKYNAEVMINSLPVSRRQVVAAKYFSGYLFGLLIMLFVLPLSMVYKIFGAPWAVDFGLAAGFKFLVISLLLLSIYLSFFFPLYFKFGYMRSRFINFISFFIIFGLINFSSRMTGSGWIENPQTNKSLWVLFNALSGGGNTSLYIFMILLGGLIVFFSLRLSVWIYSRKDF